MLARLLGVGKVQSGHDEELADEMHQAVGNVFVKVLSFVGVPGRGFLMRREVILHGLLVEFFNLVQTGLNLRFLAGEHCFQEGLWEKARPVRLYKPLGDFLLGEAVVV